MARQNIILVDKKGELSAFGSLKKASEVFSEINLPYLQKKGVEIGEKRKYKGLIIQKLPIY